MVTHLDDVVGTDALKEDFHSAQLPVGNVIRHILDVFQIGQIAQVDVADLIPVSQGKGGNLFVTQLDDKLLLGLIQTGGSFHISQLAVAHLLFHVSNILFLTFVGGILGTGRLVKSAPVGIGEDFLEDLLSLQGGLGSFEIAEPAMEPAETQVSGTEKCQNKQEVNGVENHAANTGTLFLLFGLYRLYRSRCRLLGCCLFGSGSRCGILGSCRLFGRCFLYGICGSLGSSLLFDRSLPGRCCFLDGRCFLNFGLFLQHRLIQIIQETQIEVQTQIQVSKLLLGSFGNLIFKIKIIFVHGLPRFSWLSEPSRSWAYVWAGTAAGSSC